VKQMSTSFMQSLRRYRSDEYDCGAVIIYGRWLRSMGLEETLQIIYPGIKNIGFTEN